MSSFEDKYKMIPESVPVLPLSGMVVFPYRIFPLSIAKPASISAVKEAYAKGRLLFISAQKTDKGFDDKILPSDIHEVGVLVAIMRFREFPDGRIKMLAQGLFKGKIQNFIQEEPFLKACIEKTTTPPISEAERGRVEVLVDIIKRDLRELTHLAGDIPSDLLFALDTLTDPEKLVDLVISNIAIPTKIAQATLEMDSVIEQLESIKEFISLSLIQARNSSARTNVPPMSTPFSSAVGESSDSDEIQELKAKLEDLGLSEDSFKEVQKQIQRLEKMHPESNESAMIRNYVDWVLQLPWNTSTTDSIDLDKAKKVLDSEHYGLASIKERILELLAVQKIKGEDTSLTGQILCFVGPPGVGKTSLGKSIAEAMGRKYERVALGGIRDEPEIRGHRRTYVGSMPGRIIQALKRSGSNNPVIVLDELDKLSGQDFKGDPSAALLEVLDPEQNFKFRDNYINLDFDLSNVLFVATANYLEGIPDALKDRLELIKVHSYVLDEKMEICKRHLTPRIRKNHGFSGNQFTIDDTAIEFLITHYTKEAGVRSLSREIASLCRKAARMFVEDEKTKSVHVDLKMLQEFLGKEKFMSTDATKENQVGVVNGLAWTQLGGEILVIEALKMKGQGGKFVLTGQLGDVMKESAQAAFSYAKANQKDLKIPLSWFSNYDIHIHFPAGAIPKDGPSAGTAITTALVSLMTDRKVRSDVAMTGEVTLAGRVLPVGGIRDKVLAALSQGVYDVILPLANQKDVEEMTDHLRKGMRFVFEKNLQQVLDAALKPASGKSSKKCKDDERDHLAA